MLILRLAGFFYCLAILTDKILSNSKSALSLKEQATSRKADFSYIVVNWHLASVLVPGVSLLCWVTMEKPFPCLLPQLTPQKNISVRLLWEEL